MAIGHYDAAGLVDKTYVDRYTAKEMRAYILDNPGDGFTYFIEGEINGADNFSQWINRDNMYSSKHGEWECAGWFDAREYWDVDLSQAEVKKLSGAK